jgi:hypothetical protein
VLLRGKAIAGQRVSLRSWQSSAQGNELVQAWHQPRLQASGLLLLNPVLVSVQPALMMLGWIRKWRRA